MNEHIEESDCWSCDCGECLELRRDAELDEQWDDETILSEMRAERANDWIIGGGDPTDAWAYADFY